MLLMDHSMGDPGKRMANEKKYKKRAQPGIEPGTSCNSVRSEPGKPEAGIILLDH